MMGGLITCRMSWTGTIVGIPPGAAAVREGATTRTRTGQREGSSAESALGVDRGRGGGGEGADIAGAGCVTEEGCWEEGIGQVM